MATNTPAAQPPAHRWRFYRAGGLDLVCIQTADDLRNLGRLDQKLWTALACPVKGLEIDERTLALIDTDNDGRVRAPELIAAVDWVCATLADPATIMSGSDAIAISNIANEAIRDSAKEVLASLGKPDVTSISLADVADTTRVFAQTRFNGDGVVTPNSAGDDTATAQAIADVIATLGGTPDRSGAPGIDAAKLATFLDEAAAYDSWAAQGEQNAALLPAGDGTAAAVAAIDAVEHKINDYFARCRLAAFDPRALAAVNRQETEYLAIAAKDLSVTADEIASFPLARIEPGRPLPLGDQINPAWIDTMAAFVRDAVTPLLGPNHTSLSEADWKTITAKVGPYRAWQATKPHSAVAALGRPRLRELLAGNMRNAITALIEQDRKLAPHFAALAEVERLLRFHRDLHRLLMNFVAFSDLYDPRREAAFQNGVLYLDARACELCIRVDGANPLAAMSKIYIAYCNCTRPGLPPMTIAACFTQGDSDYLFVGRHGLFYDRQGRDWDAVITSIVDNPISLRQAFWSPYKKFLRMIEEQIAKRAAAAEAASSTKLATAAEKAANLDKAKAEPAKKVDVGTVAAIGVAFGALTTAFGYLLGFFRDMPAWQVPLIFVVVMLLISLPSVIIAAIKLRQRTIGPILDGNGWAVNGRVKVTIPFGTSLTERAKLPPGAERSFDDPYAEKKRPWKLYLFLLLLACVAWGIRWHHNRNDGYYFWQAKPHAEQADEPSPATGETPPADSAPPPTDGSSAPPAPTGE